MQESGRIIATQPYGQGWPSTPLSPRALPTTGERHDALRAQLAQERAALATPAGRDRVIDRALEFAYVNQLGLPTAKRILGEFNVSASEVDRVAAGRTSNPRAGRDHLDKRADASTQRLLGSVSEPVTSRLPFG